MADENEAGVVASSDAVQVLGDKNWLEANNATSDSFIDLGLQNGGRANKVSKGFTNDFP